MTNGCDLGRLHGSGGIIVTGSEAVTVSSHQLRKKARHHAHPDTHALQIKEKLLLGYSRSATVHTKCLSTRE